MVLPFILFGFTLTLLHHKSRNIRFILSSLSLSLFLFSFLITLASCFLTHCLPLYCFFLLLSSLQIHACFSSFLLVFYLPSCLLFQYFDSSVKQFFFTLIPEDTLRREEKGFPRLADLHRFRSAFRSLTKLSQLPKLRQNFLHGIHLSELQLQ